MTTPIRLLGLLMLAGVSTWAQGFVQVSSVTADPAKLDCSQSLHAKVTAQVYFSGIDTREKPVTVEVLLSPYSGNPVHNEVQIPDPRKDVELRESPGLAEFEVACAYDTRPGIVKVSATIVSAPKEIEIKSPDGENFVGTITVQERTDH